MQLCVIHTDLAKAVCTHKCLRLICISVSVFSFFFFVKFCRRILVLAQTVHPSDGCQKPQLHQIEGGFLHNSEDSQCIDDVCPILWTRKCVEVLGDNSQHQPHIYPSLLSFLSFIICLLSLCLTYTVLLGIHIFIITWLTMLWV